MAALQSRPALCSRRSSVETRALFGKKSSTAVLEKPSKVPKKGEQKDSVLSAFDFAQTRSKRDADLLWDAKYGERGADGKMTREQYQALRRKVGGTAKDYWKDWVEEEQVKTIQVHYNPNDSAGNVGPFLPLLIGTIVVMLGVTVAVVSQTS